MRVPSRIVAAGCVLAALPAVAQRPAAMNVGFPSDFGGEFIFADLVKTHRLMQPTDPWGANRPAVTVDAIGWPTQDASLFFWHVPTSRAPLMAGRYTVSFEGQADLSLMIGSGTIRNKAYDAAANRTTAVVDFNGTEMGGLTFRNTRRTASSPTNSGFRNLRVMRPTAPGATTSYPESAVFSEAYLDALRPFSALRFMDWSATNWNQTRTWAERKLPSEPNQQGAPANQGWGWQGRGAAFEYAIQLANTLKKDMWVCVPALADDDYVRQLARLFRDGSTVNGVRYAGLDPSLKLYVEYSNEVWNWGFGQAQQNLQAAKDEVAAGSPVYNFDGNGGAEPWARRVGKRIVDISRIFRAEFGDAAMMTRIRPVFAWQQDDGQWTATQGLKMIEHLARQAGRTVSDEVWGGGGTAYYEPDNHSDSLTIDNIWTSGAFAAEVWRPRQRKDADIAATYGIRRLAYEGGPSLDSFDKSVAAKRAAVDDPRMVDLMLRMHDVWDETGGEMIFYFSLTGDFQWGFMDNTHQRDTRKMQAIQAIQGGTTKVATIGSAIPASLPGGEYDYASRGWGFPGSGSGAAGVDGGQWFSWTVRPAEPGRYTVRIRGTVGGAGRYRIWADGRPGPIVDHTSIGATALFPGETTVELRGRVGSIRVENLGGSRLNVAELVVARVARPVSGVVAPVGYAGDLAGTPVHIEVRPPVGAPFVAETFLDGDGRFSVMADVAGPAAVRLSSRRWLSARLDGLTIGASGLTGLNFGLLPGDADGDDAVTVFDYDRLSAAFDSAAGGPGWDADCDFDGDGAITVFDYDLLSQHFDLVGMD